MGWWWCDEEVAVLCTTCPARCRICLPIPTAFSIFSSVLVSLFVLASCSLFQSGNLVVVFRCAGGGFVCYWLSRRRCCWRSGGFGDACYCEGVLASCGGGAPRWSEVGGFFLSGSLFLCFPAVFRRRRFWCFSAPEVDWKFGLFPELRWCVLFFDPEVLRDFGTPVVFLVVMEVKGGVAAAVVMEVMMTVTGLIWR
ncbi:hypothetical protein QL285_013266 [Trifolium repens]|nr:hypothetical protein QL285_013266 [Trifolium repens]